VPSATMQIARTDAFLCDLEPLTFRVDATQTSKQETIFVELETTDGVVGTGYSYTIGTGGRVVLELLRSDLLARSEIEVVDGMAVPSSAPGIGIEWDREAIASLVVAGAPA